MKLFNNTNRNIINPVDLSTIDKTFSTLEKGHRDTINAVSDIKTAIASLDLNEAEDEWKNNKVNEIQKTLEDNTIYGNSYEALDDVISKWGDIRSNPQFIGKIRAQQEYKKFHDELDKNTQIADHIKEMYHEKNKYYYEDIKDKDGKIIGGSKWEPNSKPVKSVNFFDVMRTGLSIAAKESGGGDNYRWLNGEGKLTNDLNEVEDVAIYNKTTQRFERLGKDKIRKAINTALDSIEGAKESLKQDYEYALWKYNKNRENGVDNNYLNIEDKKGNILSFEQFKDNKINKFSEVSAYNNVTTSSNWGTAFETNFRRGKGSSSSDKIYNPTDNTSGLLSVGVMDVKYNDYANSLKGRDKSENIAFNILKKYTPNTVKGFSNINEFISWQSGKSNTTDTKKALNDYINWVNRNGTVMTDDDKNNLYNSILGYETYNANLSTLENKLSKNEKDLLKFNESILREDYVKGRSKYDNELIDINNKLWANNDTLYDKPIDKLSIKLSNNLHKNLLKVLDVNYINELGLDTRLDDGKVVIDITPDNRNRLPKLMDAIEKADDMVGFSGTAVKNIFKNSTFDDYEVLINQNGEERKAGVQTALLKQMGAIYKKGSNKVANVEKKIGLNDGVLSLESTGRDSYRELELEHKLSLGHIKNDRYNIEKKIAKETLDNMFALADFNAGDLYEVKDGNKFTKAKKVEDLSSIISHMYTHYPQYVNRAIVNTNGSAIVNNGGIVPRMGYILNFTVPKESPLKKYAGKKFKVLYTGNLEDNVESDPINSPRVIADNTFNVSKATNNDASILDYNTFLGNTNVTKEDDGYYANFAGEKKKVNNAQAAEYLKNLYILKQIKYSANAIDIQSPEELDNTIKEIIYNIHVLSGKDYSMTKEAVNNYLMHYDNER